ncbi:hypothetical protein L596_023508 [Steinernema carpocapsae]|uniref:UBP-type domain-containing protein n=1 Tax=Steinernema carpocapsae TaxID=34508 RepID=A0A4U5MDU9_STECR|nr:hypothetical protein L596_023508 [Steinernema carpocapsae]
MISVISGQMSHSDQPGPSCLSTGNENIKPPLFAVHPLPSCPHLETIQSVPETGIDARTPCRFCPNVGENWICLTCYTVHCSRHVNGHGPAHFAGSGHPMALSLADLSVWCYACDSYVHNDCMTPAKRAAHISKFGCDVGE